MNRKFYLILLIIICCRVAVMSEVRKETFVYAVKGGDTLRLDMYESAAFATATAKPCIIFVFGGSFMSGNRSHESYTPFYEYFAENGYAVVSIDYRLGLKDVGSKIDMNQGKMKVFNAFVDLFGNAVDMAVDDLFDATRYVVDHAVEWHIDTSRISSCGSSAGAVTVLQGEYYICNSSVKAADLPPGFRYAGVVSFAGAVFSEGRLNWANKPSPIMFFHGDADRNVPYDRIKFLRFGLYGPKQITARLDEMQAPYSFHTVENAEHEIATLPMTQHLNEIKIFLNKFADSKANMRLRSTETHIGKPDLKKKIKLKDCLKANFNF